MAETKKLAEVDITEYADGINLICEQSNTIRRVSVADVKSEILSDIQAELGYNDPDILGLQVDYENKSFKRLSAADGLEAGTDFDGFQIYGGRKRCTVADDGAINHYYGEEGYAEDGSDGQVMVYQPKVYSYLVTPLDEYELFSVDLNTAEITNYHF